MLGRLRFLDQQGLNSICSHLNNERSRFIVLRRFSPDLFVITAEFYTNKVLFKLFILRELV